MCMHVVSAGKKSRNVNQNNKCLHLIPCVGSLKAVLAAPPSSGALDLSGIPLVARDMERLSAHLQHHAASVLSLELGFTELTDEAFLLLLPTLAALPHLETLALNGNRLTRTILKELTDALKVRRKPVSCNQTKQKQIWNKSRKNGTLQLPAP